MKPYRIVLADDHGLMRQGLRRIIEGAPDLEVVGEAGNGLELLTLLKGVTADLVVLDISMPHLRGIEAIHEVKAIYSHLKLLILTMHREIELFNAAISAGASGYVLKEAADTQLFAAIAKIRQGGIYVCPKVSDDLTHDWARTCGNAKPAIEVERLTVREREVLKLTAEGKSSKEIAELLCISSRTVEHHRAHIMSKLHVRKTADVVRYALHERYI